MSAEKMEPDAPAAETPEDPKKYTLKMGRKSIDIRKALPFTVGDARTIKAETGTDLTMLTGINTSLDDLLAILSHLVRKIIPEATDEDIDKINLEDLNVFALLAISDRKAVDRPT